MPILIKDYNWRQTDSVVIIRVPLRNIPVSKVDLFTSDIYVKVHYPPYLFECCLYDTINEDESKCTILDNEAVFELVKNEKKEWPSINKDISKQEMIKIKKEAIEMAHQKFSERSEKLKGERMERQRACCREQTEADGKVWRQIEAEKEAAKKRALTEVAQLRESSGDYLPGPIAKAQARLKEAKEKHEARPKDVKESRRITPENDIFSEKEIKRDGLEDNSVSDKHESDALPPLRQCSTIGVNFTYRAFPTPSRESKLNEENEWLTKMAEARKKTGFVAEDLRPEENDPLWLLEKGKSFHDVGNYLGAVSAFSHAIKYWKKMPELWLARSESQLCLGNYRRVLQDTTEALELLVPHVERNAEQRLKAHKNRGLALIELGKPGSALGELEEALALGPYREELHQLLDRAEAEVDRLRQEEARRATQEGGGGPSAQPGFIEPEDLAN